MNKAHLSYYFSDVIRSQILAWQFGVTENMNVLLRC